ncbi:MAG: 23S rRNA (adenine(2503)-C(2))-methyltransferase RlmN [Terriglobia bacterium]
MTPTITPKQNLLSFALPELEQMAQDSGQPRYCGRQIYNALYQKRTRDIHNVTELGLGFRASLDSRFEIRYPEIRERLSSDDGTIRYVLQLDSDDSVEAVYMPDERRTTLCISSQVGCAVDCRFCFTALMGLKRNLTAGEILGQILVMAADRGFSPAIRTNVVFMGMGEPLLNLREVLRAVAILSDAKALAIPRRRITVSTVGIVPKIIELGKEPLRPKLAVSLNAPTDEQRIALMPINRKYPLNDLMEACRSFPLAPREKLTFEYVLIDGLNDSDEDARRVANLIRGIKAKVNLIPYNSGSLLPYKPAPFERVLDFQRVLTERHVPAFIRISRGRDIQAACGQLLTEGAARRA